MNYPLARWNGDARKEGDGVRPHTAWYPSTLEGPVSLPWRERRGGEDTEASRILKHRGHVQIARPFNSARPPSNAIAQRGIDVRLK